MRIIDCHCHIYPHKIAHKAIEAVHDFYKYNFYNCKTVNPAGTAEALIEEGSEIGVTEYVVHSVATKPDQVESVNRFIAEQCRIHPGFIGFGTLHPDSINQKNEINSIVRLGLKGIKLHPDFIGLPADHPKFMNIFEILSRDFSDISLPVCIHCGDKRYDNTNPDRIKHILESFPDVTILGAHFGGHSVWDEAAEKLPCHKNLYVDTSSTFAFVSPEKANEILRAFDINRILFATDYPMWHAKSEIDYLLNLNLTGEEQGLILHGNAEKLFGI